MGYLHVQATWFDVSYATSDDIEIPCRCVMLYYVIRQLFTLARGLVIMVPA